MAATPAFLLPGAGRAGPPPFRRSPQQRGTPVCSVPTLRAAAAVPLRDDVREQQADLASSWAPSGHGAASSQREAPAAGAAAMPASQPGAPSSGRSSPWQTQARPAAAAAAADRDAPLPPANRQALRRRAVDPADIRHAAAQQLRSSSPPRSPQRAVQPEARTSAEPRHASQRQPLSQQPPQQQQQRQRKQPATLKRSAGAASGRPAQLQAAVRSNRQHDWQVTKDWLLMEMGGSKLDDDTFEEIAEAADLPDACRPQVAFYYEMGLSKSDMCKLASGRTQLFHLSVPTIESKLKFLREEGGITDLADMRKLLIKCPRIVEYKTERTLRPRLDFLKRHNVQDADIPKVVMRAPMVLELSVEDTLEPRVAFLRQTACVPEDSVSKLLVKSPSLLTCTEPQMQLRVNFLRAAGFDDAQLAKAVVAFPQILYLKVEAMEARVRYLRSIGVDAGQLAQVITRLPQLLSLDIANNMAPKFEYLRSELGGSVATIAGFPAYFSLSMPQRIVPRHLFLQKVQSKRLWPFPMGFLKVTDQNFADTVAGRPLGDFEAFRSQLLAAEANRNPVAARWR